MSSFFLITAAISIVNLIIAKKRYNEVFDTKSLLYKILKLSIMTVPIISFILSFTIEDKSYLYSSIKLSYFMFFFGSFSPLLSIIVKKYNLDRNLKKPLKFYKTGSKISIVSIFILLYIIYLTIV